MKKAVPSKRSGYRRSQILNAALNCFLAHGVEATTIDQIRQASGASHGSIYHHFGSKEAIALAVYSELIKDYHALVLGRLREQTTARGGIRAFVAAHLEWQQSNRDRSLYLTRTEISDATGEAADSIAEILKAYFRAVHEWLQPFIEKGEIIRVSPSLYVPLILGPAASFSRHWLSHRLDLDMTEVAEILAEAAWKSVTPA
jgi:AcrR family transcriptional regulator